MRLKMKTSVNFDFYNMAKYVQGERYKKLKADAFGSSVVPAYKNFIKKGNVKTDKGRGLADATIAERRRRKTPPSIGGIKPLYDTGKLVQSIRYDKADNSIKAIHYALGHIKGTHRDWNNKEVPSRDFITQANERLGEELSKTYFESKSMKELFIKLRESLRKRMAK